MTQTFSPVLTNLEISLTRLFMMTLAEDKKEFFNSDDFREQKLDLEMSDPAHEIGTLFAKWRWNGISEQVGEVPSEIGSNNRRKVDLQRWNWVAWRNYLKEHPF